MRPEQLITVYHCCCAWHYKRVVPWQLDHLAGVGLKHVLCTHVGGDREWLQEEAWKRGINLVIEWSSPNVAHYETPAMFLIERLAGCHAGAFLYLHTKGVTQVHGQYHDRWRELMHCSLIEHWREVLEQLDSYDLAGVDWQDPHVSSAPHFAGNFWMVRSDWIRGLRPFADVHNGMNRVRFSAEHWVGTRPNPRVNSLLCRNVYYTDLCKM